MKPSPFRTHVWDPRRSHAFTLIELIVVLGVLLLLALTLAPGMASARYDGHRVQCLKNLAQMTSAWRMYADDNNDRLVVSRASSTGSPIWVPGDVDFTSASYNWDPNQNLPKSPLWTYCGKSATVFRCPADPATVSATVNGKIRTLPRVRSISMSHVFGQGSWLPSSSWRTYTRAGQIVAPAKTFLFIDEHPGSIQDGEFANTLDTARIIDFPANYHRDGAAGISFADGRAEIHRWQGSQIRLVPYDIRALALNVSALDSAVDVAWLAGNTTVPR